MTDMTATMRCGDQVRHERSGETWTVALVDGDYLAWLGWPTGEARISDCTLIERCSDGDHLRLLKTLETAKCGFGERLAIKARSELEAYAANIGPAAKRAEFDRLSTECATLCAEQKRLSDVWKQLSGQRRELDRAKRAAMLVLIDAAIADAERGLR